MRCWDPSFIMSDTFAWLLPSSSLSNMDGNHDGLPMFGTCITSKNDVVILRNFIFFLKNAKKKAERKRMSEIKRKRTRDDKREKKIYQTTKKKT